MSSTPAISVCIPTYNQGRFLAQAVQSVMRQTRQDFEIIVCDDASTDDTPQITAGFRDPRIHYFRNPANVGIAENRNRCLQHARGTYIAWLDSDDVYYPEMLERQSNVLDRHPQVGLVHGGFHVTNGEGHRLGDWPWPFEQDHIESSRAALQELILSNYITAPTVMVRRSLHELVGPYAPEIGRSSTDWEMWLRLALHADIAFTAAPLAQYRQHQASISAVATATSERWLCDVRAVQRIIEQPQVVNRSVLARRARAALAFKALLRSGDRFSQDDRQSAWAILYQACCLEKSLLADRHTWLLAWAVLRGQEYAHYRHGKACLQRLHAQFADSRFGRSLAKLVHIDPNWQLQMARTAEVVRRHVPRNKQIAVVDKCDPTVLHLSRRPGRHFPDRRLLPDYPRDSEQAIEHLEQLRTASGVAYLVFPGAAFWWLDYYDGLREHLDHHYRRICSEECCILYELSSANRNRSAVAMVNRQ